MPGARARLSNVLDSWRRVYFKLAFSFAQQKLNGCKVPFVNTEALCKFRPAGWPLATRRRTQVGEQTNLAKALKCGLVAWEKKDCHVSKAVLMVLQPERQPNWRHWGRASQIPRASYGSREDSGGKGPEPLSGGRRDALLTVGKYLPG